MVQKLSGLSETPHQTFLTPRKKPQITVFGFNMENCDFLVLESYKIHVLLFFSKMCKMRNESADELPEKLISRCPVQCSVQCARPHMSICI